MEIFVFALVVVVITILAIWAIDQLPITSPGLGILKALVIIIAAVVIARRAGIF